MRVVSQRQSTPGSAIGRAFPSLVYGFDRCVLFPTCPLKACHVDVVKRILRAPSTCVKVPDASCDRPSCNGTIYRTVEAGSRSAVKRTRVSQGPKRGPRLQLVSDQTREKVL